jgi:hypothetical protein
MYWVWFSILLVLVFVFFCCINRKYLEKKKEYVEQFLSYSKEVDDCDSCELFENRDDDDDASEAEERDREELNEVLQKWENTPGQAYINAEPRGLPPLTPIHSYKSYSFHPKHGPIPHMYKDPFPQRGPHKVYEMRM